MSAEEGRAIGHRAGVNIRIEADIWLPFEEVWVDDDMPENPTAEDVKALMEKAGSRHSVLDDWNLLDDLTVNVSIGAGAEEEVWS